MSASDYYVGLAFLALTYAAIGIAVELTVRRQLPQLHGSMRALAWGTLATIGILVSHLGPATLGLLSRESALLAALTLVVVAMALPRRSGPGHVDFPEPAQPVRSPDRLLGWFSVAALVAWIALATREYLYVKTQAYDALSAYLPTAARWLQEGSIWEVANWIPDLFYGSGPGHGSVVVMSTMLPWENDFLAHFAMVPFVLLTALAVYALAREMGAPWPPAAIIGAMLAAAPIVVYPGIRDGLLDPVLYATFATGLAFLVRHHRTGAGADLTIAALALGIAFGTKYYGYTAVTAVIVVWVGMRIWAHVGVAAVARQAAVVGGIVLAVGGIWMLRNWVDLGNPLLPLGLEVFGTTVFEAPDDPLRPVIGDTLASYAGQPEHWGELGDQFVRIGVGLPFVLLWVGLLGALLAFAHRRRIGADDDSDGVVLGVVAATLVLFTIYAFTPYSGLGLDGEPISVAINARYGMPAFIAAGAALAWACSRLGPRWMLVFELLGAIGLADALLVGRVTDRSVALTAIALGLVAMAAVALLSHRGITVRRPSGATLIVLAAVGLLAGALAGNRIQDRFNEDRYSGFDPVLDHVIQASGDDQSVGLAGTWTNIGPSPIYPSFGPRLTNHVEYIGPSRAGRLSRYSERRHYVDALSREAPQLLVVGRAPPQELDPAQVGGVPATMAQKPVNPSEAGWATDAGYREIERSERFILLAREPAESSG